MQAGNINKTGIEEDINKLYEPYGVKWQLTVDEPFTDRAWDKGDDGLQGTGTEFYSKFTEEMRALNTQYTAQRGTDDKSVYLFWFASGATDAATMQGDMPLESRFGYIFSQEITAQTHHTMAHELAHGVFQLRHPFSDKYGLGESSTTNLLDYDGGTVLKKYQWDLIHDPKNMLFAWAQVEEEGAYAPIRWLGSLIEGIRCAKYAGESIYDISSYSKIKKETVESSTVSVIGKNFTRVVANLEDKSKTSININSVEIDGANIFIGGKNAGLKLTVYGKNLYEDNEAAMWLKDYINYSPSGYEKTIEELLVDLENSSNINVKMDKLPGCWFSQISPERRLAYINKLSKTEEVYEHIRSLIKSTPPEQVPDLFAGLKENSLFVTLDSKYKDISYQSFYEDLYKLWEDGYLENLKDKASELYCLPLVWSTWQCAVPYTTRLDNSSSIYVKGSCSSHKETLDLFDDMIFLDCQTNFMGKESSEPIIVPAFFLRLATTKNINSVLSTSFNVGLEIGSWFIGVGKLKTAWTARKTIKIILASYGVANASIQITNEFVSFSETTKTFIKNSFSKGEDFVNAWENLKPFIDYGIYSKSIISNEVNFSNTYNTFKISYEALRGDPKFQQALGEEYVKVEDFYVEMNGIKD